MKVENNIMQTIAGANRKRENKYNNIIKNKLNNDIIDKI